MFRMFHTGTGLVWEHETHARPQQVSLRGSLTILLLCYLLLPESLFSIYIDILTAPCPPLGPDIHNSFNIIIIAMRGQLAMFTVPWCADWDMKMSHIVQSQSQTHTVTKAARAIKKINGADTLLT